MKQFLKRTLSVLVLLGLVGSGVLFLTRALAMTEGPEKNGSFLKEDRDYDVLLFGSSHMVNGIYPMELWKDYGITAYNLSGHGAGLAAWPRLGMLWASSRSPAYSAAFTGWLPSKASIHRGR